MRVAVIQTDPLFGEAEHNVNQALSLMENVEADLIILPELFNTGYNFINEEEVRRLAEPAEGKTFNALRQFASTRHCYIVYGFAEQADRIYNSAAIVGPDGLIGLYRKIHLYYREKLFFAPGNLGFPIFELPFGNVGIMICFDWMYPESARTLALNGAQIIAHPSNLVLPHCPDAMITRCLENRLFAATANRIGRENRGGVDLSYIGTSEIVTPRGEVLKRLDRSQQGSAIVDINLADADNKKINEFNDLFIDRKTDFYKTV